MDRLKRTVLGLFAIALTGIGQLAWAGPIGTDVVVSAEARTASLARIESVLQQEAVAGQLENMGVAPEAISARLGNMTDAELAALDGQLEELAAGGDVLGLVGAVFVVLLILEIVGVTDIFKSV